MQNGRMENVLASSLRPGGFARNLGKNVKLGTLKNQHETFNERIEIIGINPNLVAHIPLPPVNKP